MVTESGRTHLDATPPRAHPPSLPNLHETGPAPRYHRGHSHRYAHPENAPPPRGAHPCQPVANHHTTTANTPQTAPDTAAPPRSSRRRNDVTPSTTPATPAPAPNDATNGAPNATTSPPAPRHNAANDNDDDFGATTDTTTPGPDSDGQPTAGPHPGGP